MHENLAGIVKLIGISVILVLLWVMMIQLTPESFLDAGNLENLLRRTALFSILGIGVAFVIMTAGIDLSLGALVCLTGCFLALFLKVDYQPYRAGIVYEISQSQSSITIDPGKLSVVPGAASDGVSGSPGEIAPGQWLRMYQTKRARSGMFQITEVKKTSDSQRIVLTVSPPPSRDEIAADQSAVAQISPAVPIVDSAGSFEGYLHLPLPNAHVPHLRPRDRVWLADESGRLKEQTVIEAQVEGDAYQLHSDLDSQIDAKQWFWIGLERRQKMSVPLAILSVLGIGIMLGALHGYLVTYLRLQPFVVTLCGLLIYRGWARWLSGDQSVGFGSEYADSLSWFSLGRFSLKFPWLTSDWSLNIPYAFLVLVVVAALAMILLNWTIWGRYMLALGRNEEAARFSGINTGRMKRLAYVLSGFLAAVCGVLFAIESGSISPSNAGSNFELYAIAAAVLGGCSLRGGEGTITGVILGTALMQTIYNMMTLLPYFSDTIELAVLGGVILLGVVVDELIRWLLAFLGARRRK